MVSESTLAVFLQKSLLPLLGKATAQKLKDWWDDTPVDEAIDATAREIADYPGLDATLRSWVSNPSIAETLGAFSGANMPSADVSDALVAAFGDAGFEAVAGRPSAERVLLCFFNQYVDALLRAENTTFTTGLILIRLQRQHTELKSLIVEQGETIIRRIEAHLPALQRERDPVLEPSAGGARNSGRLDDTGDAWRAELLAILEREATYQLTNINPSWATRYEQEAHRRLLESPLSRRLGFWSPAPFLREIADIGASVRLGLAADSDVDQLRRLLRRPFTVAVAPAMVGSLAILWSASRRWELPFEFETRQPHSAGVVEAMESGEFRPDFCAIADGPATDILRNTRRLEYELLMLLPSCRQRFVVPVASSLESFDDITGIQALGIYDSESSIGTIAIERLGEIFGARLRCGSIKHLEPSELLAELSSGSRVDGVLSWSPHWLLAESRGIARVLSGQPADLLDYASFLLVRRDAIAGWSGNDVRVLRAVLNDAWLRMTQSEALCRVLSDLVDEREYSELMRRAMGAAGAEGAPSGA